MADQVGMAWSGRAPFVRPDHDLDITSGREDRQRLCEGPRDGATVTLGNLATDTDTTPDACPLAFGITRAPSFNPCGYPDRETKVSRGVSRWSGPTARALCMSALFSTGRDLKLVTTCCMLLQI